MEVFERPYIVFEPIYGFIHLTQVEWEIIHSPFYQRLRWIRQLGFSSYVFHGAEHSRYGHSIGVMHNAHKIMTSINKAVADEKLYDPNAMDQESLFHKSIRLAALMHDLGTFPFSHTTEMSYIQYGHTTNQKASKGLQDNHEHLGSYIIKNTDYEGGITRILKKYKFDPQTISDLVKGIDPSILANQIIHSEIDADRMDYLLRDAYYTGLKYGSYDRDYLIHHFKVVKVAGEEILTIKDNAIHCVEDFLNSRFAWYSQVVRSARGAKYDALAESLCFYFLEKGWMWKYGELLEMISKDPIKFSTFNDTYFTQLTYKHFTNGDLNKNKKMKDIAEAILFEKSPKIVQCDAFKQRLLNQDDTAGNEKLFKKAKDKIKELEDILKKHGGENDWIVPDLPKRNVVFVKSHRKILQGTSGPNLLLERDPVKISYENGQVKLLTQVEDSTISRLENCVNYIPNVFCSKSALDLFKKHGLIENDT